MTPFLGFLKCNTSLHIPQIFKISSPDPLVNCFNNVHQSAMTFVLEVTVVLTLKFLFQMNPFVAFSHSVNKTF